MVLAQLKYYIQKEGIKLTKENLGYTQELFQLLGGLGLNMETLQNKYIIIRLLKHAFTRRCYENTS